MKADLSSRRNGRATASLAERLLRIRHRPCPESAGLDPSAVQRRPTKVLARAWSMLALVCLGAGSARAQETFCPSNFIRVPANPAMGTYQDFCVSKYEMKIRGHDEGDVAYSSNDVAESRAGGKPWINLTQVQAKEECAALGPGYALIANSEWMTIARNIESVATNWSDNIAHDFEDTSAGLCLGHSCRKGMLGADCRIDQTPYSGEGLPASTNDADGCYGYVKGDYETEVPTLNPKGWHLFRRTYFLDNGECIWDFSGNVWEWTDCYIPLATNRPRLNGVVDDAWLEINKPNSDMDVMKAKDFKTSQRTLLPATMNGNRFGRYHPGSNDNTQGVAMRGGDYMHGAYNNGIYALGMGYAPSSEEIICRVGFRCVYHPLSATNDTDLDGMPDPEEAIAGTSPTNDAERFRVQIESSTGGVRVAVPTRAPAGRGAEEYTRYYRLEQVADPCSSAAWDDVPGYTNIIAAGQTILYTNGTSCSGAFFRAGVRIETK